MKNSAGKDFLLLLLGLGMLGSGLVLFFRNVGFYTGSQFWGLVGDRNITGALFIPFILGVVLWIMFPRNIWPKILTWVSVVAMILSIISSLRFTYKSEAFTTIMLMILIFGGGALTLKKLYIDGRSSKTDANDNNNNNA